MRPSVWPDSSRICDTAPTVPELPSTSSQAGWQCGRGKELHRFFQLGRCRDLGGAEGLGCQAAFGKEAHRQADAANLKGLGLQGLMTLAQDDFGAAPADVDDQARTPGFVQAGHTGVDQPRFLAARDHLDGEAQRLLGANQKGIAVARLAQGLGAHRAQALGREALELGAEAAQALQGPGHGGLGQVLLGVQPGAEADRLLPIGQGLVLTGAQTRDFEAKAVGTEVYGGQRIGPPAGGIEHGAHSVPLL